MGVRTLIAAETLACLGRSNRIHVTEVHSLQQIILLDEDLEPMIGHKIGDWIQISLRVDLDDELPNLDPVGFGQSKQDVEFALLDVDLEEVDAIDLSFADN